MEQQKIEEILAFTARMEEGTQQIKAALEGFIGECPVDIASARETAFESIDKAARAFIDEVKQVSLKSAEELNRCRALEEAALECAWLDWEHSVCVAAKQIGQAAFASPLEDGALEHLREKYDDYEAEFTDSMEEIYIALQKYQSGLFGDTLKEATFEDVLSDTAKQIGEKLNQFGKAVEEHAKSSDVSEKADSIRKFVCDVAEKAGNVLVTGAAIAADGVEKFGKKVGEALNTPPRQPDQSGDGAEKPEENAVPDDASEKADAFSDEAPFADHLRKAAHTAADQVCDTLDAARDTLKTAVDEMKDGLKDTATGAKETAEDAAQSFEKIKTEAGAVLADGLRSAASLVGKIADEVDNGRREK